MYPGRVRRLAVLLGAVALAGCHGGRVTLELDLPAAGPLDPLAGADELTLTARAGGVRTYAATIVAPARGATLDFGEVPVGDDVWFELHATTAAGRVVGYGKSVAGVEIGADADVVVPIRVRRPFAYVAGGDRLLAIDATREPGEDYARELDVGAPVRAAAVTADGAEVVVVTTTSVRLVSTLDHAVGAGEVLLPGPPHELGVSPDGRWAAITHRVAPMGLSIIDLAALRAGAAVPPPFVAVDKPGSVGLGGGVAWVLVDPNDSLFCGGTSSLMAVSLDAPVATTPIPLQGRAGDLAVDPDSGAAVVSGDCGRSVVVIDGPAAAPRLVHAGAGLSAVTVAAGRVWITGHAEGVAAHLSLTDVALAGGAAHTLELPTTEERAVATALEELGQDGQIRLTADLHTAFAVSVLPDGAHVAILDVAVYIGEPAGDAGGGRPIVPKLNMVVHDYQLVQLDTGLGAQRLRMSCDLTWEPGALLDDFRCSRAPGQDEAATPLVPSDLTAIYGSR